MGTGVWVPMISVALPRYSLYSWVYPKFAKKHCPESPERCRFGQFSTHFKFCPLLSKYEQVRSRTWFQWVGISLTQIGMSRYRFLPGYKYPKFYSWAMSITHTHSELYIKTIRFIAFSCERFQERTGLIKRITYRVSLCLQRNISINIHTKLYRPWSSIAPLLSVEVSTVIPQSESFDLYIFHRRCCSVPATSPA